LVSEPPDTADAETLLAEVAAGIERLAADPEALAAYRAESSEVETGFEPAAPNW
jgi:hypothetical protein